jgi:hypothetical protein
MAGHSKWANIKHRKAAADAKKGKVFTRLIKEITVAARMGGADPNMNPRLRLAMDKGREANMAKDSVQNAIKRGSGQLEGVSYEEARYEGYGPGGAAVIVDCLTFLFLFDFGQLVVVFGLGFFQSQLGLLEFAAGLDFGWDFGFQFSLFIGQPELAQFDFQIPKL